MIKQIFTKKSILFLGCFFLLTLKFFGQDFEKHKWKNRIVLLITTDINSDDYNRQIAIFKSKNKELKERKIIVYKIIPEYYQLKHSNSNEFIIQNDKILEKYNKTDAVFQIVLIGLDGGVKLRENDYLSPEKLFAIIDGMPMRKSEIRNKN